MHKEIWETRVPFGFWKIHENCMRYLIWLGSRLGYSKPDDWYQVSQKDFYNNFGIGFLRSFSGSPSKALKFFYSDHEWLEWKFSSTPWAYWNSTDNVKKYMFWLGNILGYKTEDGWYQIKQEDIANNYGHGLLKRYGGSPIKILCTAFPDKYWILWKFSSPPQRTWDDLKNITKYVEYLGDILGIQELDNWHDVSVKDFKDNNGWGLLSKRFSSSPYGLLKMVYPDYNWDKSRFSSNHKTQKAIYDLIKTRFPDALYEYKHNHPLMRFKSGRRMSSDIWIPSLETSIEVQGGQHHRSIDFFGGEPSLQRVRGLDQQKRDAAKKAGIIWLEISFEKWDGTLDGLLTEVDYA